MAHFLLILLLGPYYLLVGFTELNQNLRKEIVRIEQSDSNGETNEFWPADMIPHPHPPQPRPKTPIDDMAKYE